MCTLYYDNDKPESISKNKLHKILGHFELLINNLISARRPDVWIINNTKELE